MVREMYIEIKAPRITVNDDFVELVEWHVTEGSFVTKGSPLCSIETSKTSFEMPAERNGFVKILVGEGQRFSIQETVCLLYENSEDLLGDGPNQKPTVDQSKSREATRKALELAENLGIDMKQINREGIIREQDVRDFYTANPNKPAEFQQSVQSSIEEVGKDLPSKPVSLSENITRTVRFALRSVLYAAMWILYRVPILSSLVEMLVRSYPPGGVGLALRAAYYRNALMHMGDKVKIGTGVLFTSPESIDIGDHSHIDTNVRIVGRSSTRPVRIGKGVHIGSGTIIYGSGGVTIGDYTAVAAGSIIYTARNLPENPSLPGQLISMSHAAPKDKQYVVRDEVVIEDYAFIGLNVSILPGVTIGRGSIVNSGAVVAKNVRPYSIFGGPTYSVVGERKLNTE